MRSGFPLFVVTVLTSLCLPAAVHAGTKGGAFPGVPYSYVRAYLFNTDTAADQEFSRFDSSVMPGDHYARSKIGAGKPVPPALVEKLNRTLSAGTPELHQGLSKCFIPRHGFVYYDDAHRPVASVSICFECEGLRTFPAPKGPPPKRFRLKRAMKQLETLRTIVEESGLPVFAKGPLYAPHIKGQPEYVSEGLGKAPWPAGVSAVPASLQSVESLQAAWGKLHPALAPPQPPDPPGPSDHHTLVTRQGTTFAFSKTNGHLSHASIQTPALPFGPWTVGMSDEEVLRPLKGYQGPTNPSQVNLTAPGDKMSLQLHFVNRTLRRIQIKAALP